MKLHRGNSVEFRFWSRVDKSSPCWMWTGAKDGKGYGFIRYKVRQWRAHQFSWMAHFGAIPSGMYVCHSCDVPGCVNPAHLFLGTHSENMRDKAIKGRASRKITLSDVCAIKQRLKDGDKQRAIASDFGVNQSLISLISTGKIGRDVCA